MASAVMPAPPRTISPAPPAIKAVSDGLPLPELTAPGTRDVDAAAVLLEVPMTVGFELSVVAVVAMVVVVGIIDDVAVANMVEVPVLVAVPEVVWATAAGASSKPAVATNAVAANADPTRRHAG
jgi:hypothetical protein